MTEYATFLEERRRVKGDGFLPNDLPPFLFDFQKDLARWACETGSAAIFADCGLGKTAMQLAWADQVRRNSGGKVLVLTPLAVGGQTLEEAKKFGIDGVSRSVGEVGSDIVITNYERLKNFRPQDFVATVCDESGILKNFGGAYRGQIVRFMRKQRHRLLCSATPAPNDYVELGNSSEALGGLGHIDMLNRFFVNGRNNSAMGRHWGKAVEWRFKGHAESPFWRWVCTWARAVRTPADLGYDDDRFVLPKLTEDYHIIEATKAEDQLFALPATDLHEQRKERRRTITERCEKVAELASHGDPVLVWCHLNDEADLLESLIPGAVQVAGKHTDEQKEDRLLGFARGDFRVLVTKPRIGAWGLNYQHCAHVCFFPSHSYEQYYQGVRRCWRFGQKREVRVDVVTTEGEWGVLQNMKAKADDARRMFSELVRHMNDGNRLASSKYGTETEEVPTWLS